MITFILRIRRLDEGATRCKVSLWKLPAGRTDPKLVTELDVDFQVNVNDDNDQPLSLEDIVEHFDRKPGQMLLWKRVGNALYAAIAQGQVGEALTSLPPGSRVMLDVQDPQLQRLPWELICSGRKYLLGDEQRPWCRLWRRDEADLSIPPPPAAPDDDWPMRMMIVLAAEEEGEPDPEVGAGNQFVFAQYELERIHEALVPRDADVDIWVIKRKSKASVVDKIRQIKPHLLHFIGHAFPEVQGGAEAALLLYDQATNQEDSWSCSEIINDLKGSHVLRLVFLNACATGASTGEAWALSEAFLQAGVPAVLSMRTDVAGESAAAFAEAFYRGLAKGYCLDAAVERGRKGVTPEIGWAQRDWAVPSLQLATLPEQIVVMGCGIEQEQRARVEGYPDFRPLRFCVDRWDKRHESWRELAPLKPSVLVLRGNPHVGKTTVAKMVMERCALKGYQVRYVDFSRLRFMREDGSPTELDVLQALRHGWDHDELPRLTKALTPPEAFTEFDSEYGALAGKSSSARAVIPSNAARHDPTKVVANVFEAFRRGIETCAAEPGLVLVFDHLTDEYERFPRQAFDMLREHLFEPFGREPNPLVRLIIVATGGEGGEFDVYNLGRISGVRQVPISLLTGEYFPELFMSYIFRNLSVPEAEAKPAFAWARMLGEVLRPEPTEGIDPSLFETAVETIQKRKKYHWTKKR
jgi:hypothetical protein